MLNVQSNRTSVAARGNVQGTMPPRSHQAAHHTTTSAFMSNVCSMSVVFILVGALVGRSNKKCNVHVHGLSCKDTFTITSMLMSSSCTHDLFLDHKIFRLCVFPETMICKDEYPNSYSHSVGPIMYTWPVTQRYIYNHFYVGELFIQP